jgi:hypothetical protein
MLTTCCRPTAGKKAYKSAELRRLPAYVKRRPEKAYKLLPPFGRLAILKIGRPTAGYKACNMLATYGWRSMVKLVESG